MVHQTSFKCPACRGAVDRDADTCPQCGYEGHGMDWVEQSKPPQIPNSFSERVVDSTAVLGAFLGLIAAGGGGLPPELGIPLAAICFLPLAIWLLAMLVVRPIRILAGKGNLGLAFEVAKRRGAGFASFSGMRCPHCNSMLFPGHMAFTIDEEQSIHFDLWGNPRCNECNGELRF